MPGLALRAHHLDGALATKLNVLPRRVYAATYGDSDPPAVAALLAAVTKAARAA